MFIEAARQGYSQCVRAPEQVYSSQEINLQVDYKQEGGICGQKVLVALRLNNVLNK